MPKLITKRDGRTKQPFDVKKIERAVAAAYKSADVVPESPDAIVSAVLERIAAVTEPTVEQIQTAVEDVLMASCPSVARAYILYRQKRLEARKQRPNTNGSLIADYIHRSKYARYVPELGRRESFEETVTRVKEMHLRQFTTSEILPEIPTAFDAVYRKEILPSMRSMQFGGAAIEANNNRLYNCSSTLCDRPRVFAEALFLLLAGCGVGYSIQKEHVERLPRVCKVDVEEISHHVVADTIEGWADALDALVRSYLNPESVEYGRTVEFAYHLVRGRGVPLKTSGGRAPGHRRLKEALEKIRRVLDGAQGRKLRAIECHRIFCHAADAVLSGGIRRSAMIALFSVDDEEMFSCKSSPTWFETDPWFQNANNSAMCIRSKVTEEEFRRVFSYAQEYGEPGVAFVSASSHTLNPCSEITKDPVLVEDDVEKTGWAFCNLCEINAAKLTSREDFLKAARAATLIGTLQASYTKFPYLGEVSEKIARRDALLGIGITGMQDSPTIALDPVLQREVALKIVEWNAEFAAKIGISSAARTSCVKPSGTTSLELGSIGSGIHPHHARRYIRRVTADELEIPFQAFRLTNPHACVRKPDGKWVIEFAVEAPSGATVKADLTALEFLAQVRSTQENWVVPGTARESRLPGARHNVSNTITVKPEEWGPVADYIWAHRDAFTGVSTMPDSGDVAYAFAPFEAVKSTEQERRWNELARKTTEVDYSLVQEQFDSTSLSGEAACAGGACEWKP